ncbi:T9SS type A sorting domain-containing protein [Psychroserpens damuponensis]|uniref:T9SS type A sorting domain-containing protein n=1 Tax=Psychroserpens damuponensis TaxID=943936 RepID=UPI00058B39A9|nr:T9SS type A sorting domain-containing protein [Psychroserpens damuponensis]
MKILKHTLKSLFGLVLLFFTTSTKAQTINTTLAQDINNVFSLLEKNRIPHNILLDYGFDRIDVASFDGVLRTDNYIGLERYGQIYNALVSSATAVNVSGFEPPSQELTEWQTLQKQKNDLAKMSNKASVILNGLLYKYSKINSNALANNKIQVINGKYDDKYKRGAWQNPYDVHTAFAISAPILYINKPQVEVSLPATLWHSNTTITNLDIDFGDGNGYKSILNNTTANTTYTNIGTYDWTYRVQLSNGQYKYCRQKVKVTQVDNSAQARNPACGQLDIEEITASKSYQGVFGTATLQIAYGSADCQLRNPLIIAEGLDTGLLAQAGSIGDSDYNSFRFSVLASQSPDLQDLITNNTAIDYDIVYVNWDNGTDFIQRNAFVLEAVIDWVNTNKTGNAQNVVLGQSMGGLIARYALRDMENNSEDHDTNLYISHDAPHQGAHLPPGILHMGRHVAHEFLQTPLGNINIPVEGVGNLGLATINDLLDAPAINQMLISGVNSSSNRDDTVHTNWQTELNTMGYPQQTRNIALSNASHCAEPQGLISNQSLLTVTGNGGTSDFTSLVEFFLFLGPLVGDFLNDTPTFLLGFLPGNTLLDAEFRVNAFPSSGISRVYKGRLTYKKTLLWLVPITRTIFDESKNSQPGDLFLDNFPGGANPSSVIFNASDFEDNFFFNYGFNLDVNLDFDFIPVTSALDVGSGNTTLTNADYFRIYTSANPPTGSKAIPFDSFSTSLNNTSTNEPHITFNRRNGDWLAAELDVAIADFDFDCSFVCDENAISGSGLICNTATYSINSTDITNIDWDITPVNAGTITENINDVSQITITRAFGYSGTVTLSASVDTNRCGNDIPLSKTIHFGRPTANGSVLIFGDADLNPGPTDSAVFTVNTNNMQAWSSIDWVIYSGSYPNASINFNIQSTGGSNKTVVVTADASTPEGSYYIQSRITNSCGYYPVDRVFYVNEAGDPQFYPRMSNSYSVYPNPSKDIVNITSISDEKEQTKKDTKVSGELFDVLGKSKLKVDMQHNKAQFSVARLNPGVYVLKIYLGEHIETHQVLVK